MNSQLIEAAGSLITDLTHGQRELVQNLLSLLKDVTLRVEMLDIREEKIYGNSESSEDERRAINVSRSILVNEQKDIEDRMSCTLTDLGFSKNGNNIASESLDIIENVKESTAYEPPTPKDLYLEPTTQPQVESPKKKTSSWAETSKKQAEKTFHVLSFKICVKCSARVPANFRICGRCGSKLKNACPHCGGAVPANMAFCGKCGRKIV